MIRRTRMMPEPFDSIHPTMAVIWNRGKVAVIQTASLSEHLSSLPLFKHFCLSLLLSLSIVLFFVYKQYSCPVFQSLRSLRVPVRFRES